MNKILVTLAAVAMSAAFALVGAPTASANDDRPLLERLFLEACVSGPGWVTGTRGGAAIPGTGVGIGVTAGSFGGSS